MDYQAVNLTGNASGMQAALDTAIAKLNAYNAAAQSVLKVNLSTNKVTGDSIETMERMVNEYTKLTTAITTNAQGQVKEASSITLVTNEIKKQAQALKDLEQAKRTTAAQIGESQTRAQIPVPQNINTSSLITYQGNLDRIKKLFDTGKISADEFNTVLKKVGTGDTNLSGFTTGMTQAFSSLTKMKTAVSDLDTAGNKLVKTGGQLGLTWKNIFNIGEALIFKEILSGITTQMSESVASAVKLQIQIAEIRTISQESQSTFSEWNKALTNVSSNLGIDIHDVAGAAYEALSNQTTKGAAQTEKFLTTAGEFARTTVSTTKDAVDLLSSAFNAYKIPVEDAERVSAIFFKTIDLGRIRATELANTFGRIAQPAAMIGVTLEETAAALTTLTRQGVTAHDAQTQLLNVFTRLLKPAGDLKALMESWGTPTIQAANATFGFAEVLKKLEEAAKGSSSELANLFPDTRGLRGIGGLTQKGQFDEYQKDLEKIQNAGPEYDLAKSLRAEPAADQLIKEFNRVKNFFINDFATNIIKTAKDINDVLGKWNIAGFGSLSESITSVVKALTLAAEITIVYKSAQYSLMALQGGIALAQTAYAAATALVTTRTVASTTATYLNTTAIATNTVAKEANAVASLGIMGAMTGLLPVLAAGGAAFYLLYTQISDTTKKSEEFKNSLATIKDTQNKKDSTQRGETAKASTDNYAKDLHKSLEPSYKAMAQDIQELEARERSFADSAAETDDRLKNTFANYIDNLKRGISEFEKSAEQANNAIKQSGREVLSVNDSIDQTVAKLNERYANEYQKMDILKNQIAAGFAKVAKLVETGDLNDLKEANRLYREIEREKARLIQLQQDLGDQVAKNVVEGNVSQLGGLDNVNKYLTDYQKRILNTWGSLTPQVQTDPGSKNAGKEVIIIPHERITAEKEFADVLAGEAKVAERIKKIQGEIANQSIAKATELKNAQADFERAYKRYQETLTPFKADGKTVEDKFRVDPTDASLDVKKLADAQKKALDDMKKADAKVQAILPQKQLGPSPSAFENAERDKAFMDSVTKRAKLSNELFKAAEDRNTAVYIQALTSRDKAYEKNQQDQVRQLEERLKTSQQKADTTAKELPANAETALGDVSKQILQLVEVSKDLKLSQSRDPFGALGSSLGIDKRGRERQDAARDSTAAAEQIAKLSQFAESYKSQAIEAAKAGDTQRFQGLISTLEETMKAIRENLEIQRGARERFAANSPGGRPSALPGPIDRISLDKTDPKANTVGQVFEQFSDVLKNLNTQAKEAIAAQQTNKALKDSVGNVSGFVQGTESAKIMAQFTQDAIQGPSGLQPALEKLTMSFNNLNSVLDALNKTPKTNIPDSSQAPPANIDGGVPAGSPKFAKGGIVGGSSGIDTNPAWLTRGEYVMPVAQTQAFMPLLKAIHTGVIPRGTGSNINTTVGDVNITVQGPMTKDKTIREIGEQLRREIRRGNVVLS